MVNAQDVMNAVNARLPFVTGVLSGAQQEYNPLDFFKAYDRLDRSAKIKRIDSLSARAKLAAIWGDARGLEGVFTDDAESVKRDFEKRGKEKLETYALSHVGNLLGELGVGDQANPEPGNEAMMRLIFNAVKPESAAALARSNPDNPEDEDVKKYNNVVQTVAVANQGLEIIKRNPAGYVAQRVAAFQDEGVQDYYRSSPELLESLAKNGKNRVRKVGEAAVKEYDAQAFITSTLGSLPAIRAQVKAADEVLDNMVDGPQRYALSEQAEGLRTAAYSMGGMLKGLMGDAAEKVEYKLAQEQAAQAAQQAAAGNAGGRGRRRP